MHWKHAEGLSLRYGVVEFVELRANGAHYNIKRSRFLLVGEPALWGYVCGLRLIWWRACSRRLR